jgi:hypothetical protein
MARDYSLRASASFSPEEVRLLAEMVRAVLRRDRGYLEDVARTEVFSKFAAKTQTMNKRVEKAKRQRQQVADVMRGVEAAETLDAGGQAELARRQEVIARYVELQNSNYFRKMDVAKRNAEEIRRAYVELVDSGILPSEARALCLASYTGHRRSLGAILKPAMLDKTRAAMRPVVAAQEAAE